MIFLYVTPVLTYSVCELFPPPDGCVTARGKRTTRDRMRNTLGSGGEMVLLFPGGIREALHGPGEEYQRLVGACFFFFVGCVWNEGDRPGNDPGPA